MGCAGRGAAWWQKGGGPLGQEEETPKLNAELWLHQSPSASDVMKEEMGKQIVKGRLWQEKLYFGRRVSIGSDQMKSNLFWFLQAVWVKLAWWSLSVSLESRLSRVYSAESLTDVDSNAMALI